MSNSLKMYIFINTDLNMTSGKIASQACHVTHLIVEEIIRNFYEGTTTSETYINYMYWNKNCTKIILKANTEQLIELLKLNNARGFYDNGQTTQVPENSLTVVGFFPCFDMEEITTKYKLL